MSPLQVAAPTSRLAAAILADSPISYWRLNDAVGATAPVDQKAQSTGAAYTSYVANGIGRQGPTPGDASAGSVGLSISSVGRSAVTFTTTAPFNVGPPFTVEFMVMTTSANPVTLVNFTNASSPFNGYGVGISHTTAGLLDVNDGLSGWRTSASVNDGNWHHIVVVFSGSTATVYKDGASAGTITLSGAPTPYSGAGSLLGIGGTNSKAIYMSEVAVYNGALSATRIAAHYNATLSNAASDRIELLTAAQTWEGAVVAEPNLYWDGSQWCMIYRGSGTATCLGYATCTGSDPTIPGNWTKYASNPIVGGGAGSFSDHCYCPSIYFESGTLYVTFTDTSTGDIYMCSGSDALHLGTPAKIFTHSSGNCGNMWIVKNSGTYYMLFEQQDAGDSNHWKIGVATCATVNGTYTVATYPITLGDGQTDHGGPWFYKDSGGTFHLWYHGSYYGSTSLPTQIFKASSTDPTLITWTTQGLQVKRSHVHEYDQVADPQLVIPGSAGAPSSGPAYLLWDGDDNVNPAASIFIARTGVMPVTP